MRGRRTSCRAAVAVALIVFAAAAGGQGHGGNPDSAAAGVIAITVEAVNAAEAPDGELLVRDVSTGEARTVSVTPPGAARIRWRAGSTLDVQFVKAGWWAPAVVVRTTEGDGQRLTITAHRTGRITGQLTGLRAGETPPEIIAEINSLLPRPERAAVPGGSRFRCSSDAASVFSCDVPAGSSDLLLRPGHHAPVYRWDVKVPAGGTADLGKIPLKRGGSIVAWLHEAHRDAYTKKPVAAKLFNMVAPGVPGSSAGTLRAVVAHGFFNARGFVQIAELRPGTYVLEVSAEGFAPARVFPLRVAADQELVVRRAIEIRPPLAVCITVTPAADSLGRPWAVTLDRLGDFAAQPDPLGRSSGSVATSGEYCATGQSAGNFTLVVRDAAGNSLHYEVMSVNGPEDARRQVPLSTRYVEGQVRAGDQPLPSTVRFGGRSDAVSIKTVTDDEGRFRCELPRLGKWRVDVASNDGQWRAGKTVEVSDEKVIITIPVTEVAGWVIDSAGNAAVNVTVNLIPTEAPMTARTSADGRFRFRGVPHGRFSVSARDRTGAEQSRPMELELGPEREQINDLELALRPATAVEGRVLSSAGAVAGARLHASPVGGGEGVRTGTQADGSFHFKAVTGHSRFNIVVAAPGHALQAFSVERSDAPMTLQISRAGGDLVIDIPPAFDDLTVTQNGAQIPYQDLLYWAEAQGHVLAPDQRRLVFANVAPGAFDVCAVQGRYRKCASGTLVAGGSLQLRVDG